MNNIVGALKNKLRVDEPVKPGEISGSFVPDPDFPGFQGHFPGNPILPGACLIEAAVQLVAQGTGQNLVLAEVERLKFFSPVSPGNEVKLFFNIEQLPDAISAKGSMMSGQRKICTVKLKMSSAK